MFELVKGWANQKKKMYRPQATEWERPRIKKTLQVEVNAKYALVNDAPLLSFKGMEFLIMYKFNANIDNYLSLTVLRNSISLCAVNAKGETVQIVGCPTDQISLFINYDGLEH